MNRRAGQLPLAVAGIALLLGFVVAPDVQAVGGGKATPPPNGKPAKPVTPVKPKATSPRTQAGNSSMRSARSSAGRTATSVGGTSAGGTPAGWRQSRPSLPADLRAAIARGTTLKKPVPGLEKTPPGALKLSRHLMRESVAPGLGTVVSTRTGTLPRANQRQERVGQKQAVNQQVRAARAGSGRSATSVEGSGSAGTPNSWRQSAPLELRPTSHLTREYVYPGLGKVVATKPMTAQERANHPGLRAYVKWKNDRAERARQDGRW